MSAREDRRSFFTHPTFVGLVLCITVGFIQLWIITDSFVWHWPRQTSYYPALTDAFLHGQLSLRLKPPPELLALPDPYDPVTNQPYRLHDAVLFGGKYYLYWGPVPALVAAAVTIALGIAPTTYCDQQLVFAFSLGTVVMVTMLMLRARSTWFPQLSAWRIAPAVLTLGLGAPLLSCGGVYGAAITAGQFFFLGGLLCAWSGISSQRWRSIWMLAAGLCWALSCGSRISLPPAVAAVTLLTLWYLWRAGGPGKRNRSPIRATAALAIPLVTGGGLMGWYNFARFHSVTDFGFRYVLAGYNQHTTPVGEIASTQYVIPNLLRYLLENPQWIHKFPFLWVRNFANESALDQLFRFPGTYTFETLVGLTWCQPFLALAIMPLIVLTRGQHLYPGENSQAEQQKAWLILSLYLGALLGFMPPLSMNLSAFRYLVDAVPSLSVLAAIGYFQLLRAAGDWQRWTGAAVMFLALGQILMGILLACDNHHAITLLFHSSSG